MPLPALIRSLTLGKSLHVSVPECPYLQNSTSSPCKLLWCKDENCCLRGKWWQYYSGWITEVWILVVETYAHCACVLFFSSSFGQIISAKHHPACRGLQGLAAGLLHRICKVFENVPVVPLMGYRSVELSWASVSLWESLKKNHRAYMTQCDQMPEIFCSSFLPVISGIMQLCK